MPPPGPPPPPPIPLVIWYAAPAPYGDIPLACDGLVGNGDDVPPVIPENGVPLRSPALLFRPALLPTVPSPLPLLPPPKPPPRRLDMTPRFSLGDTGVGPGGFGPRRNSRSRSYCRRRCFERRRYVRSPARTRKSRPPNTPVRAIVTVFDDDLTVGEDVELIHFRY